MLAGQLATDSQASQVLFMFVCLFIFAFWKLQAHVLVYEEVDLGRHQPHTLPDVGSRVRWRSSWIYASGDARLQHKFNFVCAMTDSSGRACACSGMPCSDLLANKQLMLS